MTFEEIVHNKQLRESVKCPEGKRDTGVYIINEKCFNCKTTMSFSYEQIPIWDYNGNIICRPLRLYAGRCVKCKESHYALFYGEPQSTSVFFLPDATMLLSEYSEYENLLSTQQLNDLKSADQAYKAGLFAGAFLYIRRVLESLVFQILDENKKVYNRTDKFKDLVKDAESFVPLFPDDLTDLKGPFYKFISEGVHVWTDQQCSVQYPLADYAIRRILDHYKSKKENEKKNNLLRKAIGEMENGKRS